MWESGVVMNKGQLLANALSHSRHATVQHGATTASKTHLRRPAVAADHPGWHCLSRHPPLAVHAPPGKPKTGQKQAAI
jgi:hypothetical protein